MADQYLGIDLFLDKPNWISDQSLGFLHPYELLSFIGLEHSGSMETETGFRIKGKYTALERAEIAALRAFFDSKRGRLEPFWMPSWQPDLRITEPVAADATEIITEYCEYSDFWAPNAIIGRYIYVLWPDGEYVCRKIISAPDEVTIEINEALEREIYVEELPYMLVCFLNFVRFDLDEIEFVYATPEIADIELAFMTLQAV